MWIERNTTHAVDAAHGDGVFSAVLASEGEASDGHIISVRGIETRPSMPMLFGHYSSEQIPLVGSVRKPMKTTRDGTRVLRVEGHVNLNGDGILSEIRRGLYQLVQDGDLNAMSIRIDTGKTVARKNLSKDHPAFIDSSKVGTDDPRYFGQFIERSSAKEGSLVALGADPSALIGRSEAAGNAHVQAFFRAMSATCESDEHGLGEIASGFSVLRDAIDDIRALGVDDTELADYLSGDTSRSYIEVSIPSPEGESLEVVRVRRDVHQALCGESLSAYREAIALREEVERERASQLDEERRNAQEKPAPPKVDMHAIMRDVTSQIAPAFAQAASDAVSESIAHALGRVRR